MPLRPCSSVLVMFLTEFIIHFKFIINYYPIHILLLLIIIILFGIYDTYHRIKVIKVVRTTIGRGASTATDAERGFLAGCAE